MALSFGVLLCVVLALWIYFIFSRWQFYKAAWKLPGPWGLPFIGLGLQLRDPETFIPYLSELGRRYTSPIISWLGTKCFLYVGDPETAETVLKSPSCTNKGDFYRFMASSFGDGLFTSSNPRWSKHRRLINPAFSKQIINNFFPIFNAEGDVLLEKLKSSGPEEGGFYEKLKKCVLAVACQTTMGKKVDFQNDSSHELFDSYMVVMEILVQRMLSPWLYPDFLYQWSRLYAVECKTMNILRSFIENLLSQKQSARADRPSNAEDDSFSRKSKSIFVEQVRNLVERGEFTWDDIRDEANVIIAATFETTSTAVYLVALCLATHPEYQDKLFEELQSVFPEKDFTVTNEDIDQLTYTDMVVNEALRLLSPVPAVLRTVSEDIILKNGVTIPKNTQVALDIFNMQRDTKWWGPKAKEFYPDHFHKDNIGSYHPYAYIPFTKGLRMCIGYKYALLLVKIMIAKVFRNFRLRTESKMEDLVVKGTISLKFKDYPVIELEERKD